MAVLVCIGKRVFILLEQFVHLQWLDFLQSSLDVDLVIHEMLHLVWVVNLLEAAELSPEVVDVFDSVSNDLFFTAPE
jgi:hypothetical protein